MVAIIKSSGSLRNILYYNENKLKQNVASLIHSINYGKDTELLSIVDKLKTIEKQTELNQRTRLNAVHISLNFGPTEKLNLSALQKISEAYIHKIGFGNQPCLVYEHYDSGHPHIHIVTTNIRRDGSRISMQNIGSNQSEKARLEIEKEFKLNQVLTSQLNQAHDLKPVNAQKLQYGKSETKRAITNVLDVVLTGYKYASLPELNAVLRGYNVLADRGGVESRTFKYNGLVYRVLDEQGNKIGTPVKASLIYNKPGLKFLEDKFIQNGPLKQRHKLRVKNAIDLSFTRNKVQSIETMMRDLRKEKIQTVLRKNDNGLVYGVTYVDHHSKCVFNGSDLGKPYSANMILARCNQQQIQIPEQQLSHKQSMQQQHNADPSHEDLSRHDDKQELQLPGLHKIAGALMHSEYEGYLPADLRKKQTQKRKRKRFHE